MMSSPQLIRTCQSYFQPIIKYWVCVLSCPVQRRAREALGGGLALLDGSRGAERRGLQ